MTFEDARDVLIATRRWENLIEDQGVLLTKDLIAEAQKDIQRYPELLDRLNSMKERKGKALIVP